MLNFMSHWLRCRHRRMSRESWCVRSAVLQSDWFLQMWLFKGLPSGRPFQMRWWVLYTTEIAYVCVVVEKQHPWYQQIPFRDKYGQGVETEEQLHVLLGKENCYNGRESISPMFLFIVLFSHSKILVICCTFWWKYSESLTWNTIVCCLDTP